MEELHYHKKRQRVAVPYVGPWNDENHTLSAREGKCYRNTCDGIAHHGWRNDGMWGAKYCLECIKKLPTNLMIPIPLSEEDQKKCGFLK